ncbi:uncharacterized protein LOC128884395 isoform X2 [Hylaeus volcanicus]|uniref:uncharacterized protein LOC128884395 isoform X2 n=1 Tax=Hylaeus volcanicus TaxID=313075 RepID=UPI0023B83B4D|nr:uncharacterized protein LOC128884395 isoform X2 [Hylaeus volcanicus]
MNNQFSNDREFEKFNDLNKSNDNVEFINKAIVRRGYAYYIHEVAHENLVGSLIKNFRDLETFSNVPGFSRGLIYRSGYFGSSDPTKLLHILKYVLQVRSIIDLRGFILNEHDNHERLQTSMYPLIDSTYQPLVYDCISHCWSPIYTSSSIQSSQQACRASRHAWDYSPYAGVENQKDYHMFSFKTASVCQKSLFSPQNPFQWMYDALNGLISLPSFYNRSENDSLTTSYESENYCKRILVSGAGFIKVVLETVTSVPMPLLICSTDGVHRVGIISLLILAIVGATHEVMVTDYCASEAGLMLFGQNRNEKPGGNAEIKSQNNVTCDPNHVRRLLEFIKNRWGSIEGYLDYINFDRKSCKKLRNRLIWSASSTNVQYKIPASAPFWTESSFTSMPNTKKFQASPEILFFPNASMQRILRVVFLLGLRDTLDYVSMENSNNVYLVAKEKLRSMKKKLQHEKNKLRLLCAKESKQESWHLYNKNLTHDEALKWNKNVQQLKEQIDMKKKIHKIHQSITNIKRGLQEIYLARQIILEKLTDALYTLTRSDIVKFILYRNTQIYAERNRRISVRKCPDLFDIYLDQPHIFCKKKVRKVQDITKIVVKFLKDTNQIKFLPSTNIAFTNFKRVLARYENKTEKPIRYMGVKPHKRISFLKPDFFFHELCENKKNSSYYNKRNDRETFGKEKPWPKTFGQWLMECWMISLDSPPIPDPFEETRDECFVPPDILVKYIRHQIHLRQCHQPLFDKKNMNIEEALIVKRPVKRKSNSFSLSNNKNVSHEKKILTLLKEHLDNNTAHTSDSLPNMETINLKHNSTMKQKTHALFSPLVHSKKIQQSRNTVRLSKLHLLENECETSKPVTTQQLGHGGSRSQESTRPFHMNNNNLEKLLRGDAKNLQSNSLRNNDIPTTPITCNQDHWHGEPRTKDLKRSFQITHLEKLRLKQDVFQPAKNLVGFVTEQNQIDCNKLLSHSEDANSLLHGGNDNYSDFDSEEERDWLIQEVLKDPLVNFSMKQLRKKSLNCLDKKSGNQLNYKNLIPCDALFGVPKFDEYLANWSLNSFTISNKGCELIKTMCFNSETKSSEDNDFDNSILQEETRLHMI